MPASLTPEAISQMRQQLMQSLAQRQQGWGQAGSGWLQNLAQSRWNNVGQQAQQQPWLQGIQNWLGRSPSQMGAQAPSWLGGMPWAQGAQQSGNPTVGQNWIGGMPWGGARQQAGANPALALAGNQQGGGGNSGMPWLSNGGLGSTREPGSELGIGRPSIPSSILSNPNSTNRGGLGRTNFDY